MEICDCDTCFAFAIINISIYRRFCLGFYYWSSLAYFGVLSPEKFLPAKGSTSSAFNHCVLPPGLYCTDFKVMGDGTTTISVKNILGKDVTNVKMLIENECTPTYPQWSNADTLTFNCIVTNGKIGELYRHDITVTYTDPSSGKIENLEGGSIVTGYS